MPTLPPCPSDGSIQPPACKIDQFKDFMHTIVEGIGAFPSALISVMATAAGLYIVVAGGNMILGKISGRTETSGTESSGTDLAVADDRADYYNNSSYETVHDDYIDVRDYRRVRDDD
ncbi:hypothetical protein [Methylomonas koyamae]|uniref:hypothetical protein n=2 Tax=Methylomonas koyamae TaxID=702114 RepID=UPI001C32E6AC|nr:hypothetical protein [Methylomonas koyamae]BBL58143.1 hypothetical protein MKFW12EY_17560 [Methylomonas koyamae]